MGRRGGRDPYREEADLQDQRDAECDRHPAGPRLADIVIFYLLITVECLQNRHRYRGAGGECREGDYCCDRVRPGGRAGAGDADPEKQEVSGLECGKESPESQKGWPLRLIQKIIHKKLIKL